MLQEFRHTEKRDPLPSSKEEDVKKLFGIGEKKAYDLSSIDATFDRVFTQNSKVPESIGGQLSQDVIKAISQKTPSKGNLYFYDSEGDNGYFVKVEDVGVGVKDKEEVPCWEECSKFALDSQASTSGSK